MARVSKPPLVRWADPLSCSLTRMTLSPPRKRLVICAVERSGRQVVESGESPRRVHVLQSHQVPAARPRRGPGRPPRAALPPGRPAPRAGRAPRDERGPGRLRGRDLRPRLLLGCRGAVLADARRLLDVGRVRRRVHPAPVVRGGLLRPHRPHRGRPRRLRPEGRRVRRPGQALLRDARPDPGHAPGQRRRHPVPLGDLRHHARAGAGRPRPDQGVRRGARRAAASTRSPPRSSWSTTPTRRRTTTPRTTTSSTSTRTRTGTAATRRRASPSRPEVSAIRLRSDLGFPAQHRRRIAGRRGMLAA